MLAPPLRNLPTLEKGACIAIVASARKITSDELMPAIEIIKNWGFEVLLGKTIGLAQNQFAGSDDERRQDLQEMLDNPKVKAILFARGGYGMVRILDDLNFSVFTQQAKWLIGYSDVTILHSHVNNYLGIQTLHASMPINFSQNTKESLHSIYSVLVGEKINYQMTGNELNVEGNVEGQIIGGNLSILYSILGTNSGFNPDNKILFMEDLDEYLYHIDRMVLALKRANKLSKLKALVVGGMTKMNDNAVAFGKTAEEIILEHCSEYGYPIAFGANFGHVDHNLALKLGANYKLSIAKNALGIEEI